MSKRKNAVLTIALASALVLPAAAQAEDGDYGFWDTLYYLIWPKAPDNPVTPAQRSGNYPLLSNPASFNDGFKAGAYGNWQTVQLAPGTGAVCGDGSPYKFFVNRAANTSNTLIYMEGGGVCSDYATCTGKSEWGARNPNGIPDDYMSLFNPGASLVSPFVTRVSPFEGIKTQNWNLVYVPYCTGDEYTGDKVAVYTDPTGEHPDPLVYHHNGLRNQRAIVSWLKDNLQRPAQMVATGCSAGGAGSFANYHHMRRDIAPNRGFLLNDAGPLFDAPVGGDPRRYPSLPIHNHLRSSLNLPAVMNYFRADMPGIDPNNIGSLMPALANKYPNDRFGIAYFWQDMNYSTYSYQNFYDDIIHAPDTPSRNARIHDRWITDTRNMQATLDKLPNYGYYNPQYRDLNMSHCSMIVDFKNGDIQEKNLELRDFINNVLDGSGPVMKASEKDDTADHAKPFNLLYYLVNQLLGV